MKNLSLALNVVLFVLVAILFGMYFSLKKSITHGPEQSAAMPGDTARAHGAAKIAYINLDTMNAHYQLMKDLSAQMQQRLSVLQNEYNTKSQALQQEYAAYQQKAQSGNISQIDAEKDQQDMQNKKNVLDDIQGKVNDLEKEMQDKNVEMEQKVNDYIATYNKKAHYDYVLAYASLGSQVLCANKQFDITKEILAGINQQYADSLKNANAKH